MNQPSNPQQYNRIKHSLFFIKLAWSIVLLIMLWQIPSPASFGEISWANFRLWLGFTSLLFILFWIGSLPLSFIGGYSVERKFNLSNQSLKDWFIDQVKGLVLTYVIVIVVVSIFYGALALTSRSIPAWFTLATVINLISFLLGYITPTLIIPLFFKYFPLLNQSLKSKITTLCGRFGFPVHDVSMIDFSAKTKKANAFFCGLGNSRRIVLADTLVNGFTDDEISAVVAHELGHLHHKDILKALLLRAVFVYILFYVFLEQIVPWFYVNVESAVGWGVAQLILLGVGFMGLVDVLSSPVVNFFSRKMEKKADVFALNATRNKEAFISMMNKLATMNLAELQPKTWVKIIFYGHPTCAERIEFAKQHNYS